MFEYYFQKRVILLGILITKEMHIISLIIKSHTHIYKKPVSSGTFDRPSDTPN